MSKKTVASTDDFSTILNSINETIGGDSLMMCEGGPSQIVPTYVFSTGVISIDIALGIRGIPEGRIIELYGAESSGKTTLSLQIMAACQKHYFQHKNRYGRVCMIDAEHALDTTWAKNLGVDTTKLAISQPSSGEAALRIVEKLVKSDQLDLIVIDSVAALTPQDEINGEIGDSAIGAQARLMSSACRKLVSLASTHKTTIIFINQVREKIGVRFGNPETTPGGRALRFYSSIRCEIIKGSATKVNDVVIGFRPNLKIVKNKVSPPFTNAHFDICVGKPEYPIYGIDTVGSLLETGEKYKIITKAGSHYSYNNIKLGNGIVNACKTLRSSDELVNNLRNEIYSKAFGEPTNIPDNFSVSAELIDE